MMRTHRQISIFLFLIFNFKYLIFPRSGAERGAERQSVHTAGFAVAGPYVRDVTGGHGGL